MLANGEEGQVEGDPAVLGECALLQDDNTSYKYYIQGFRRVPHLHMRIACQKIVGRFSEQLLVASSKKLRRADLQPEGVAQVMCSCQGNI